MLGGNASAWSTPGWEGSKGTAFCLLTWNSWACGAAPGPPWQRLSNLFVGTGPRLTRDFTCSLLCSWGAYTKHTCYHSGYNPLPSKRFVGIATELPGSALMRQLLHYELCLCCFTSDLRCTTARTAYVRLYSKPELSKIVGRTKQAMHCTDCQLAGVPPASCTVLLQSSGGCCDASSPEAPNTVTKQTR